MADSLRGQLLIAAPSLHDYFRRTVVLVIEHTEEGAMGVMLNRESETPVAEAVPQLAALADEEELVRIGGPVSPQSVVALGEFADVA
jgi:putative transcriptional regulator